MVAVSVLKTANTLPGLHGLLAHLSAKVSRLANVPFSLNLSEMALLALKSSSMNNLVVSPSAIALPSPTTKTASFPLLASGNKMLAGLTLVLLVSIALPVSLKLNAPTPPVFAFGNSVKLASPLLKLPLPPLLALLLLKMPLLALVSTCPSSNPFLVKLGSLVR